MTIWVSFEPARRVESYDTIVMGQKFYGGEICVGANMKNRCNQLNFQQLLEPMQYGYLLNQLCYFVI